MSRKILILGGTKEAAELAAMYAAQGINVITSLAGRTREPRPLAGEVRVGGFGGAEKLAAYLTANTITELIDATHPFAHQISANAKTASEISGIPLKVIKREPWSKHTGDMWIEVPDLETAENRIPAGARVLLALGRQYIASFANRDDVFFLIRMVDKPENPLPFANHKLLIGKPSSKMQSEVDLLTEHAITHIVCRNSGGSGAYAKIEAARNLSLPVIMIERIQDAQST